MTISCCKWLKTAFGGGKLWSIALEPKDDDEDIIFYNTVNLLLKDNQGGLFISRAFEGGGGGGLIETGGAFGREGHDGKSSP